MGSDRVWFVAGRFERLRDLMFGSGYALDPGARDRNEWQELHREDPPTGLVRLKGIRLRDPGDEDSDFDPAVSLSINELWSADHVDGALEEQGFFLVEYSYHAHYHGVDQRWDFDPTGHPEMPHHYHPPHSPTTERLPAGPVTPREAVTIFEDWIAARS